jgi:branched-chain amino acid transport system permease protein
MAVSGVAAKQDFNVILISILTLNLQLALSEMFVGLRSITGGSTGRPFTGLELSVIAEPLGITAEMVLYYVLLVVLLAFMLFYVRLIDSKYGLAFDTIREDELAAASIGVDVVRYKTINGAVAAAMIGFTGVLYAQRQGYVLPPTFSFSGVDVLVLIVLIVGGLRTTFGPVVGAAIVIFLEEGLKRTVGEWETAVFGALLIVLFLYFRSGVVPAGQSLLKERLNGDAGGNGGNGGEPESN